jgi:hypothetical protein
LLLSAEAEYKALSDLSREIVWLSNLIKKTKALPPPSQIKIFVDNKAAIDLANLETAQNAFCTEHMEIRLHFVWEHVHSDLLNLQYIKSKNNPADFLTKSVGQCTIKRSLHVLGITARPESTLNLTT